MGCCCSGTRFSTGTRLGPSDLVVLFKDGDQPISPAVVRYQIFNGQVLAEGQPIQWRIGTYYVPLDLDYFQPGAYTLVVEYQASFQSQVETETHEFEVYAQPVPALTKCKYGWW